MTGSATSCDQRHCITCGDNGEPMKVLRVNGEQGLALCSDGTGSRRTVETALVDPVAPGELLLVHAGTAIARVAPGDIG